MTNYMTQAITVFSEIESFLEEEEWIIPVN
jgi:hypothetical protein